MLFAENVRHQITIAGMALLTEALSHNVDVTGWKLLDKPTVTIAKNGTITLKIAVPSAVGVVPVSDAPESELVHPDAVEEDAD